MLGRQVALLFDGDQAPGAHTMRWDGRNDAGVRVASGIYFMTMRAEAYDGRTFRSVKKMILTR
jgi:flagellar hook assembly protein FlgD